MPMTLPPVSRRRFLSGSLATGAGLLLQRQLHADDAATAPDRFVLMADTHIAGDKESVVRGAHMFGNLKQVAQEISTLAHRPQGAIINGDCAYSSGQSKDYGVLAELMKPVREAGIATHLILGNHDHRERLWTAIPAHRAEERPVVDRHVTVIETPQANWFLLDSLQKTNHTPGTLGQPQLEWLSESLEAHKDKPALVAAHHNPDVHQKTSGLTDTAELFGLLRRQPHVKAYFFGHTHNWHVESNDDGIHLVNLPPVAYLFRRGNPNGWVDVRLTASGASLQLRCLDKDHPKHGQTVELTWRS